MSETDMTGSVPTMSSTDGQGELGSGDLGDPGGFGFELRSLRSRQALEDLHLDDELHALLLPRPAAPDDAVDEEPRRARDAFEAHGRLRLVRDEPLSLAEAHHVRVVLRHESHRRRVRGSRV